MNKKKSSWLRREYKMKITGWECGVIGEVLMFVMKR
jgi:hypothetical protein